MGGQTTFRFWALSVLLTLSTQTGFAQQPATSQAADQEARALFQAGQAAYGEGRWEDALGHFERAFELSQRTRLHYNIGQAANNARNDRRALQAFEAFLAAHPDDRLSPSVRARAQILRDFIAEEERIEAQREAEQQAALDAAARDRFAREREAREMRMRAALRQQESLATYDENQVFRSGTLEVEPQGGGVSPVVWVVLAGVVLAGAGVAAFLLLQPEYDENNLGNDKGTQITIPALAQWGGP